MVRSPELRRPPVRCRVTRSGLCGSFVVMSSFTSVVWKRSVGVIGLYVLIGIFLAHLHRVDVVGHLLTRLQTNIGLLPIGAKTGELAPAPFLAQKVGRTDAPYLYLEQRLDRLLYFGLGRIGSYVEHQGALGFLYAQTLFGNHWSPDHVIDSRHQATTEPASLRRETVFFNVSCNCSIAAREKMARS